MAVVTPVLGMPSIQPLTSSPPKRLRASTLEDVDALVIPEQITAKATRKVMKCTPKALWAYSAAPAAWGYLVTISR